MQAVHDDPTILVAEDDELIRAIICEVLGDYGFRTAEAATTAGALRLIDERDDLQAAFIDIDLGDRGGGYLVARRVRERRPGMKIVYTSGGPHSDFERERVDDAEFVSKPYRPDNVCNLIARRLG
jgi:CheY-like chemotaxis protein